MKSYLGRIAGKSATHQDQLDLMAKLAWQKQGVAMLRPDDINNAFERQMVINLAIAKYGERKNG